MRRLLYVQGSGVAGIRKDGESLLVQVDGQAERRYPFRMLSRVVLRGDTKIHAAAIWGLLAAGVPITLQSRNGEPCGFALPFRSPSQGPPEWAECLLENPDGRDRWQCWIRARERTELRRLYRQFQWRRSDWRASAVEMDLTIRGGAALLAATSERRTAIASELAERFSQEGIPPALLARLEKEMNLLTGLTRILAWQSWAAAVARSGAIACAAAEWEREREAETARIHRWVRQVVYWLEGSAWQDRNDRRGW